MKHHLRRHLHRMLVALAAAGYAMMAVSSHAQTQRIEDVVAVGDTISVTVYDEPDLNVVEAKVKRRGVIAMPLIGEVQVVGRTADQINKDITARLLDGYLKKPSVAVDLEKFHLYYIKGEVRNPGGYKFVDGLTIEQAITLAGGLTEKASETDIRLTRSGAAPARISDQTAAITPGDVITVGESFF